MAQMGREPSPPPEAPDEDAFHSPERSKARWERCVVVEHPALAVRVLGLVVGALGGDPLRVVEQRVMLQDHAGEDRQAGLRAAEGAGQGAPGLYATPADVSQVTRPPGGAGR